MPTTFDDLPEADTASGVGAFDDLPDVKKTGGAFDDLPEAPKIKRFIMPPTAPRSGMELGAQNVMGEARTMQSPEVKALQEPPDLDSLREKIYENYAKSSPEASISSRVFR